MQGIGRRHPISPIPLEAFHHGSWHMVDLVSIRNGKTFIWLKDQNSMVENEICANNIRLRSRKANSYDCSHLLKVGVDVCVLSGRPISEDSDNEPQPNIQLWYDAKIISKKSNCHDGRCCCLYSVILYRERALNGTGNDTLFERAELVTVDRISILQKLIDEPCEDGFNQWRYSEDCIYSNSSKLVSGVVSSEFSWLVVLSIQRGISFHMKSLQKNLVYQILTRRQVSVHGTNTGNRNPDKVIKIMCFYRFNETLQPVIKMLDSFFINKETREEIPLVLEVEPAMNIPVQIDSEEDVKVLYDYTSLRRSKRQKVKPRRFTSYSSPTFDRSTKNTGQIVEILESPDELSDSVEVEEQIMDNWELCIVHRSSDEEYEMSPFSDRKKALDWKEKDTQPQLLLTMGEDICEVSESNSPSRLTQDDSSEEPVKQHRGRPRKVEERMSCGKVQHLYKKRFSCRRKLLLSAAECEHLIRQCMKIIENEMEDEVGQGFQSEKEFADEVEDFNWSPSPEDQFELDEHEDLWKEMEHTLKALALLKQQEVGSETFEGAIPFSSEDGDQSCSHYFRLDDQIGIICQLCNFVHTEIRNIMPQFLVSDTWNTSREPFCKQRLNMMGPYCLDPNSFDNAITNLDLASLDGVDNVWALIPELKLRLYTHQKKAFEFIWMNIAGSIKPKDMDIHSSETGGCVIAHSPGSGKTLLLISFIISYLRLFPRSRPLILAPKIAVYVWFKEFEKWGVQFPLHIIHPAQSFGKETLDLKIQVSSMDHGKPNRKMRHLVDCISKLQDWHKESSVLLMSYSSFSLMQKESKDEHKKFMAKVLQNSPGLLILDEGHNPRSTISKLRKLLMGVSTKSRILLSGTLFQNNFEEYFNTLCLARPNFVDSVLGELDPKKFNTYKKSEKRSKRKERVARKLFVQRIGEKIESSMEDDRKQGFDALNRITTGFVDMYEDDNSGRLPGLVIYTLVLHPTDIQHEVLVRLQSCLKITTRYPIELELLITVGSIHPWLIKTMAHAEDYFNDTELEKIEEYKDSIISGSKVKFVFDIVHKSILRGEKVLIFAHNIPPITLLVRFFETFLSWRKGEEVLVLQGDQDLTLRAKIMDKFNGDAENLCKVLIASTSACAEGISLTAASRVVLLDSEWNHSKTRQAIARAFRPGQERKVYVYKLLASGTWEEEKYRSNEWKAWLSKMISLGEYFEHRSCKRVEVVDDEILRELQEEDQGKMFQMIMEQN